MRVVLSPFCAPWESNDGAEYLGSLDGAEQLFHELAPPVREMVKRRVRVPHGVYCASGAPFVANGPPSGGPYLGVIHSRERSVEVVLKPKC